MKRRVHTVIDIVKKMSRVQPSQRQLARKVIIHFFKEVSNSLCEGKEVSLPGRVNDRKKSDGANGYVSLILRHRTAKERAFMGKVKKVHRSAILRPGIFVQAVNMKPKLRYQSKRLVISQNQSMKRRLTKLSEEVLEKISYE